MLTSVTGTRPWSTSTGASLVEVMAALFIASMVAGAAMLMAPSPTRTQHQAVRQLAARLIAAGDESIMINRRVALVISPEGYGFERYDAGGWSRLADRDVFSFRSWPAGLSPRELRDAGDAGDAGELERVVIFDPVGGASPASVILDGDDAGWLVRIDGSGVVHVDPAA